MFMAISHLNLQSREDSEMTASKQKDMFVRYVLENFFMGLKKSLSKNCKAILV